MGADAVSKIRAVEVNGYEIAPGADLYGAYLASADLRGADLSCANLTNAILWGADLSYAKLVGADLTNASSGHAIFTHANLTNAELPWAVLNGANFDNARLIGANFGSPADVGSAMINCGIFDDALEQFGELAAYAVKARFGLLDGERKSFREVGELLGVTAEAARRLVSRVVTALRPFRIGAELVGASFDHADLTDANLENADLTDANLANANLTRANLSGAELNRATMPDGAKQT